MCRVMVLSRSAFESLERNHPISARRVLYNLQKHAEDVVKQAFPEQRKSKVARPSSPPCCPHLSQK